MKILFLTQANTLGPASRVRVYQYLPYLKKEGIQAEVRPAISSWEHKVFYSWKLEDKIYYLQKVISRRIKDLFSLRDYPLVFLQKEILPGLYPIFEEIMGRILKKKIIFDFDGTLYLPSPQTPELIKKLHYRKALPHIFNLASWVIAGNSFLKSYAQRFTPYVSLLPTSVDTDRYSFKNPFTGKKKEIVIGWIGSPSNTFYLNQLLPIFRRLSRRYPLAVHTIGASPLRGEGFKLIAKNWSLETEIGDLSLFDIGVAPLKDDEWSRGKCGYKTLQYMAMGIPCIATRVGVHHQIIEEGVDGFLASTQEEWKEKLSCLIEDQDLRERIALAGRAKVEKFYSLKSNVPLLKSILTRVYNS